MASATILMIGGAKSKSFIPALQKRYHLILSNSGKQAIEQAQANMPQVLIFDADSMRTSGIRTCRTLRDSLSQVTIIHIIPPEDKSEDSPADIILKRPFTWRKLVNAIDRVLKAQDDRVIISGPFVMNISSRILIANQHEIQLNPKQAALVEIFLRHPNQTLSREMLMQHVWDTDYMGDTRTLDVHIRWVRKALEKNPRNPEFLKTVRGIGYRLEIPDT